MTNSNNNLVSPSNSYSRALYELSYENNSLNDVEKNVDVLIKLFLESDDFNSLIKDPTNKQKDQLNIISIISETLKLDDLTKKFLNFLVIKRRLFYLEKILKDFISICSNQRGEVLAKITAAKELDKNEINKVKSELSQNFGSNVKVNYKYDPSLIGGLIIQVGSLMIDTSIKNKLKKIENKMIEA